MNNGFRARITKWARGWGRALLAEVLSTALLVWLGCATCVQFDAAGSDNAAGPAVKIDKSEPALSFGFMVMANMIAFGSTSGAHMNPAVTLGAVLFRQLRPLLALGYVVAQLVGATAGYAVLLATTPKSKTDGLCMTSPARGVTPLAAVVIETAITFTLVLVVCNVWATADPTRPDHTVPIKVGLVVAGLIYGTATATGASLNPARSFGPSLLQGDWTLHWVYWVGPLLGGALAAAAARCVLSFTSSVPAYDSKQSASARGGNP